MTLRIQLLPAGYGDCLVVEYGPAGDLRQVLVDAGPQFFWKGIQAELMRRDADRYELFVVTHVDEDHIGGAISVLDDPNLKRRVDRVWFNGYVHCREGGNVLGPVNGEQLTERIVTGPFRWNVGFPWAPGADPFGSKDVGGPVVVPSEGPLPAIELPGGARVVLLSPTPPKLAALERVWTDAVRKAGLVPGGGDTGHTKAPGPTRKERPPLPDPLDRDRLEVLAGVDRRDGSAANGSCIAVIVEYDGKRLLLGGDAHASVLAAGLGRYAAEVGEERVRLDAVKLPHHGSNANVSTRMLELVDCERWLVSSDGDNYGHPDDAALAKVLTTRDEPVTFYCNYRTARTGPWAEKGPAVGARFVFAEDETRGVAVTL